MGTPCKKRVVPQKNYIENKRRQIEEAAQQNRGKTSWREGGPIETAGKTVHIS